MSLILALGSNLKNKKDNLKLAQDKLKEKFDLIKASKIYRSDPVDYLDQEEFYNQVLEFELPTLEPLQVWEQLRAIEKEMGREKIIPKGPRNIDIDLIFWGLEKISFKNLIIPHPSWNQRSFVVLPLKELPYFDTLKNHFEIPENFSSDASPIS